MSLPNVNFITNKLAVKERWLKLYRKIHNLFLVKEIVHAGDFRIMLQSINARMSAIEANMAAGDAAATASITTAVTAMQAALSTHVHPSPQAPAGMLSTLAAPVPPAPPIPPSPAPVTPMVKYTDALLKAYDGALRGIGPAMAPIGDGISAEATKATIIAKSDVGI